MDRAEWINVEKTVCHLYRKSLSDWSRILYAWVGIFISLNFLVDATGAEDPSLHSLNSCKAMRQATKVWSFKVVYDEEFYKLPLPVLKKVISILEKQGKAQIFQGSSDADLGVKFFWNKE